jgi:hypothetical protein
VGEQRVPSELEAEPDLAEYFDAYLVYRAGGKLPWEFGKQLPRRRFYEACTILSHGFELIEFLRPPPRAACPFFGGAE